MIDNCREVVMMEVGERGGREGERGGGEERERRREGG